MTLWIQYQYFRIEQAGLVCSICSGIPVLILCVIKVKIEQVDQVCSVCSGILFQYCLSL